MTRLWPAILCAAIAVVDPANAKANDGTVSLAPFAYLNSACLIDPTETDFEVRARDCAILHAQMKRDAAELTRTYAPSNTLPLERYLDQMFIRQEKDARLKARRNEAVTRAYARHLHCLGSAMLADEDFRAGDGFDLNRVKSTCPDTRGEIMASRKTAAEKRSFKYLRLIETGSWSRSFSLAFGPNPAAVGW